MKTLQPGDTVPSFTTVDQNENIVSSSDLTGKKSIVFFYPRANTPGCTAEACNLRDNYKVLLDKGYKLFGVSADAPKKQKKHIRTFFQAFSDCSYSIKSWDL